MGFYGMVRLFVAAGLCLSRCEKAEEPTLALRDVTVVDVVQGSVSPRQTVLIGGDRIVAVGPVDHVDVPNGATVVEGAGRYLIPGLIDMHVHTLWDWSVLPTFLPLFVANGVTAVRDMGGTLALLRELRASMAMHAVSSPRIIAAGAILDGPTPVHADISLAISTTAEAAAAVDSVAAAGADFVKVYTLLPRRAFEGVLAAARKHGLPVVGHVPYEVGPVAAATAGMRTIEHLMSEVGGFCTPGDTASCETAVAAFRQNGTWHVPTLVMQGQTEATALCGDPRLRYLPATVLEYWFDGELTPQGCDRASRPQGGFEPTLPMEAQLVRVLHEGGIPLLAGTDAGVPFALPGWSLHDELHLLVRAGLSPLEALRAATSEAARALGRAETLGAIQPGYGADLVLLSANPLENINNTRQIEAVVLNGQWLGRDRLDAVLTEVAASVEADLRSHGTKDR
jgi:imidazolonepropionase-like amidohydrolase